MLHHRKDTPSLSKTVRETQAEAVAFVVSRGIGLETNNAAADYISLYNGDKKTLAESLAVIQATSARILNELFPKERVHNEREANSVAPQPDEKPVATYAVAAQSADIPAAQEPIAWDR